MVVCACDQINACVRRATLDHSANKWIETLKEWQEQQFASSPGRLGSATPRHGAGSSLWTPGSVNSLFLVVAKETKIDSTLKRSARKPAYQETIKAQN